VRINIQPITVAIADADLDRRAVYERLMQGEDGITLLTNATSSNEVSNDHVLVDRRLIARTNVTASENEVARIKRLKPLVLLVNLNLCTEEDYAFLLSLRHECPEALMVLLADDSIHESQIIQALEIGARGYLKYEAVQFHLSMAIRVVSRGEAWVPRKMLGNIMDHMLNQPIKMSPDQ
jgi:DNA-binding NarL/FixJ family response regulator